MSSFYLAAFASEKGGASLEWGWSLILFQILIVVGIAQGAGALAQRFRQPRAVGEMLAGLALGPSLLGWIFPDFFQTYIAAAPKFPLSVLSQIGLIFLLFQIGLEFEFSHLKSKQHRKVISRVWVAGILVPLALGGWLGWVSQESLHPQGNLYHYSLFMAVAISITALPILGRILIERGLERSKMGVIAISCAAADDVAAWFMLAVATGLARHELDWLRQGQNWVCFFFFISFGWFVLRPWLKHRMASWLHRAEALPPLVLALVLSLIFCFSLFTQNIGIFAIFGAFYLGVLLHDQKDLVRLWRQNVSSLVMVFFVPIFFTFTGLRVNIPGLSLPGDLGWLLVVIGIATLGKWGGCYLAARFSGMSHPQSQMLGVLMNTRALMELVVANVALDVGAISQKVFTMLVVMAIVSTIVTGPVLESLLNKNPNLRE